jgi:pyruvate-formate lyase
MTPETPKDVIEEAAQAILSGGAQPYLMSDHYLVPSLEKFGAPINLRDARDYCADGCWEPIIQGQTEFGLCYTPVMNALEAALNRGATYIQAGSTYLRGANISFPSPRAEDIVDFNQFLDIFYTHYRWLAAQTMNNFVNNYGSLRYFCPSPLLSALVTGCMESGRDLTNAGARYHFLAPMIFGIQCAIDSLWAIKKMVFDRESAVTSLSELRDALLCDWGHHMIEPLQNRVAGSERAELNARRFKQLREIALALPKFGQANNDVDEFGAEVAASLGKIFMDTLEKPAESVSPEFAKRLQKLYKYYTHSGHSFVFKLTPAYGTFEDYCGLGLGTGASADGRRMGSTLSSNFSPMPSPSDKSPSPAPRPIKRSLQGWNGGWMECKERKDFEYVLNIPGPVDIDIPESTEKDVIKEVIYEFAKGKLGSNILSITCCDKETMQKALKHPERYDLVRLRMGGWSEFYVSMFPDHQQQHLRRPMFVKDKDGSNEEVHNE